MDGQDEFMTTVKSGVVGQAEQTRARYPDEEGYAEREGVRIFWERYGEREPTLLLMPPWSFGHSRVWKGQIPYFARHLRVVTFDARGTGRSDRPQDPSAYVVGEFVADALAVMDASATEKAVLAATSRSAQFELALAGEHPERVRAAVFVGPFIPLTAWPPFGIGLRIFDEPSRLRRRAIVLASLPRVLPLIPRSRSLRMLIRGTGLFEAVDVFNRVSWERDYAGFLAWFWSTLATAEAHSTKHVEDGVGWGLDTDPDTAAASWIAPQLSRTGVRELCGRVGCPVLVVHGGQDLASPIEWGEALATETGGRLQRIARSSHAVFGRWPVAFNLAVRDFIAEVDPASAVTLPPDDLPARDPTAFRPTGARRALFVSSPIGLGHAARDVAIARELRSLAPDLEIDWLAEDPVTRVLEAARERIHPASR